VREADKMETKCGTSYSLICSFFCARHFSRRSPPFLPPLPNAVNRIESSPSRYVFQAISSARESEVWDLKIIGRDFLFLETI